MKCSLGQTVFVCCLLLIKDTSAAADAAFLPTDPYEQLEDGTTATYVDGVTPESDFADVTDFLTVPDEVTDDTTTSSQNIAFFTPTEAPDVAGLTSTIDTSSELVASTAIATMPSKYPSLSTQKLATTGELISRAEIGHWNGITRTVVQFSSAVTTAAALSWSPSLASKGDSVSTLNASAVVGATSGQSMLLSSDADAVTISASTTSSRGSQNINATTRTTMWNGTIKNIFTSSIPASLSGGSNTFADVAVPTTQSITTEIAAAVAIQSSSTDTNKSTSTLMPLTKSGVINSISVFPRTTVSAATKDLLTNSRLTTSRGTTVSAFSITTPPASLGTIGNPATFAKPVTSSSSFTILGTVSKQVTTPAESKYVTVVSAPPTYSGTVKNIFTLSKPVTSPGTTTKVVMSSTPKISRASMHYFSVILIICALFVSKMFAY